MIFQRAHISGKLKNSARDARAFTMVEVLVALALTMLIIPLLVASYIGILNSYEQIQKRPARDLDLITARNALLAEADYDIAQKGDQFEGATPGRQVTWSALIEPTNTADLFQVTLTCVLSGGSDNNKDKPDETITEIFRVLRPTWSQGTDSATLRAANKDRILQNPPLSPLSGITGGDKPPTATGAAGGGKNTGKAGAGKGGTGGAKGGTGKSGSNTGKGSTGKSGGGNNNIFNYNRGYFNNNGNAGNNNGGKSDGGNNNGGNNSGAKGGARPKR